jgi:hypothetical protein
MRWSGKQHTRVAFVAVPISVAVPVASRVSFFITVSITVEGEKAWVRRIQLRSDSDP